MTLDSNKQQQKHPYFFYIVMWSLLFLFFLPFSTYAQFLESASFKIENPTIIVGGGRSSSASFQFIGSTGEFVIGESTSLSFGGQLGFLYFPALESGGVEPGDGDGGGGSGGSRITREVLEYISDPEHLRCKIADFNCDGFVNLFDLSILLYYAALPYKESFLSFDLSQDGEINLVDISIMLYYWDE